MKGDPKTSIEILDLLLVEKNPVTKSVYIQMLKNRIHRIEDKLKEYETKMD